MVILHCFDVFASQIIYQLSLKDILSQIEVVQLVWACSGWSVEGFREVKPIINPRVFPAGVDDFNICVRLKLIWRSVFVVKHFPQDTRFLICARRCHYNASFQLQKCR